MMECRQLRRHSAMNARPTRRIDHLRRGSTLVELVIALGVAAIILAIAVGIIHLMLTAERHATHNVHRLMTVNRLTDFVRADVHAATAASLVMGNASEKPGLALTLPDGKHITYSQDKQTIDRLETGANGKSQRERFHLPANAGCRFETLSEPSGVRMVVTTPRGARVSGDARNVVQVEAVTARDHRFEVAAP